MIKNEKYIEIPTHVGSTTFVPHFTIVECNAISNVAGRVEPYGEHFEFVPVSYDVLRFMKKFARTNDLFLQLLRRMYLIAEEEKSSWNK